MTTNLLNSTQHNEVKNNCWKWHNWIYIFSPLIISHKPRRTQKQCVWPDGLASTKEQRTLFLKYIVVYNVVYINSLRFASSFFFLHTTYCMQHDSGYTVYGASLDIGRLLFKTNAKWKGGITLQRPDRWCINSLSLYWVVYRSREKKETHSVVDCGRWRSVFVCCVLTVTIILCCWQPQLCRTVGHISCFAAAGCVVILTFHF